MNQLTLVLPFAHTPPELAKDLVRALEAPALATLLARSSSQAIVAGEPDARLLPHEAWLARAHGATAPEQQPFAHAVMRGLGLPPQEGWWFMVQPVHLELARTHMTMADPRALELDDADSRALFELAKPYFEDVGKPLLYGSAQLWFMRADDWRDLRTASPDAASGDNLADWMPDGAARRDFRKLQNEVQMLWHDNAINEARAARRLKPVNSFWMWGGAAAGPAHAAAGTVAVDCPAWLEALALAQSGAVQANNGSYPGPEPLAASGQQAASPASLLARNGDATVIAGSLVGPGKAGDWSPWLFHMQELEQHWLAPLLDALKAGKLARLKLVLTNRATLTEFTITKGSLRRFWRKPSLAKLST